MSNLSLKFEVFGKVQGVYFRRYTQDKANELGLVGWCRNTARDTVDGVAQGPRDTIDIFKQWLRYKGSPYSQINDARFEEEEVESVEFKGFSIRQT